MQQMQHVEKFTNILHDEGILMNVLNAKVLKYSLADLPNKMNEETTNRNY